jgi:hypothetical protein
MHGQGYADLHFVIPETVERIWKGTYYASKGILQRQDTLPSKLKKIREE